VEETCSREPPPLVPACRSGRQIVAAHYTEKLGTCPLSQAQQALVQEVAGVWWAGGCSGVGHEMANAGCQNGGKPS